MFRLRSRRRKRSRRKGDTLKRAEKRHLASRGTTHISPREMAAEKTKIKYIKSNLMSSSSSARLSIYMNRGGVDREKRLFGAGEMSCVLPSPITGDMAAVANESNGRWIHIEIHQAKHRLYSHRNDIGRGERGTYTPTPIWWISRESSMWTEKMKDIHVSMMSPSLCICTHEREIKRGFFTINKNKNFFFNKCEIFFFEFWRSFELRLADLFYLFF